MRSRLIRFSIIAMVLAVVFLFFSMAIMGTVGGSAIGGKIENGRYYVYSATAGYIETSIGKWIISFSVIGATLLFGVLGFFGMAIVQLIIGIPFISETLAKIAKKRKRTL